MRGGTATALLACGFMRKQTKQKRKRKVDNTLKQRVLAMHKRFISEPCGIFYLTKVTMTKRWIEVRVAGKTHRYQIERS